MESSYATSINCKAALQSRPWKEGSLLPGMYTLRKLFIALAQLQACTLVGVGNGIKFMPISAWYWCYSVSAVQLMTQCVCLTPLWWPEWQGASTLDAPWWLWLSYQNCTPVGIYHPLLCLPDYVGKKRVPVHHLSSQ